MPHVYSTATANIDFVEYSKVTNIRVLPTVLRRVHIKGGANLPLKSLETPPAVRTEVSNEDLAFLMSNDKFLAGIKRGFLVVEADKFDVAVVANDMTPKDGCAPKTDTDFIVGDQPGADVRAIKVG